MQLSGKRIIVTGGSQGIGEAAVHAFVNEGAQVFSLDINEELGVRSAQRASATAPGSATFI